MGMRLSPSNSSKIPTGPKRTRKVGSKSHEGCKVCKKRHLKCDEAKPHCKRCTVSGWDCEYDTRPLHLNWPSRPVESKTPSGGSPPNQILVPPPSVDIHGTPMQRRSFHYFRSRNVSTVPGNFEPYFWDHLVLQMSHRYPTIQQSMFALSAMYEEHSRSPGEIYSRQSYSEEALRQYNTAIKALVQYLSSPHPDPRATLVSCLIFVWIEFLQARTDLAFGQVKSGIKIIRETSENLKYNQKEGLGGDAEDLIGSLSRSFTRLEIQAAIHGAPTKDEGDTAALVSSRVLEFDPIPMAFSTIFESRNCLDREINAIYTFVREVQHVTVSPSEDQVKAFGTRRILLQRLNAWHFANAPIIENLKNSAAISYLQMYYNAAKITLEVLFTASEMVYDHYTPEFERILQMASRLIKPNTNEQPVLSFDMGVMPPLSFVVMKCRVLRLRHKAIALLKMAPGQEGMWCRETMLKYCVWKVTLEEQGRGDLREDEYLPEEARVPVPYPQGIRSVGEAIDPDIAAAVSGGDPPPGFVPKPVGRLRWQGEEAFSKWQPEDSDAAGMTEEGLRAAFPGDNYNPIPVALGHNFNQRHGLEGPLLDWHAANATHYESSQVAGRSEENMDEFINRLIAHRPGTRSQGEDLEEYIARIITEGDGLDPTTDNI